MPEYFCKNEELPLSVEFDAKSNECDKFTIYDRKIGINYFKPFSSYHLLFERLRWDHSILLSIFLWFDSISFHSFAWSKNRSCMKWCHECMKKITHLNSHVIRNVIEIFNFTKIRQKHTYICILSPSLNFLTSHKHLSTKSRSTNALIRYTIRLTILNHNVRKTTFGTPIWFPWQE